MPGFFEGIRSYLSNPENQQMMAYLADYAGSRIDPENPMAGFAQKAVRAKQFAKLLQQGNVSSGPTGGAPVEEVPELLRRPEAGVPDLLRRPGLEPTGPRQMSTLGDIFSPGVDARVDSDNNVTLTRKLPAQARTDVPEAPRTANPFLLRV